MEFNHITSEYNKKEADSQIHGRNWWLPLGQEKGRGAVQWQGITKCMLYD